MEQVNKIYRLFLLLLVIFISGSCHSNINEQVQETDRKPVIEPDYADVTIPPNIAPMNFIIKETGDFFKITATSGTGKFQTEIKSSDGMIRFREKSWRRLVKESQGGKIEIQVFSSDRDRKFLTKYEPLYMEVAREPIDPYLAYRLIHPGYYSWSQIKIVQRSIESYEEESLIENQIIEKNCANCHSFNRNNADRFLIHIRGSLGGTYFVEDGTITRTDPKIDAMPGGATYPSWHPDGRYVAFSSNQVRQSFYSVPEQSIEVFDLVSSLVIYDRKSNEILNITDSDTTIYLQTFPSWSADGKYLYFCRALQNISGDSPTLEQIKNTHYDLARKSFDPDTRSFGETEIVFNATVINKSASFPRISPDGRYLIFTLADYGTFPIWHREADLYLLDLQSGTAHKMSLNSKETESYHTWSSNGKWLVFSSKRLDGRSGRPYFAFIDTSGNQRKPFVLPQKDPSLYSRMLESFNIPEFVNGRIKLSPRDFAAASRQEPLKANPGDPLVALPVRAENKKDVKLKKGEIIIHE